MQIIQRVTSHRKMSVYEIAYFVTRKALGKLRNTVEETCFLSMFPCLPTSENIVVETKFTSQEAKIFPNKFRDIFVV